MAEGMPGTFPPSQGSEFSRKSGEKLEFGWGQIGLLVWHRPIAPFLGGISPEGGIPCFTQRIESEFWERQSQVAKLWNPLAFPHLGCVLRDT